jgi:hypothetical protein
MKATTFMLLTTLVLIVAATTAAAQTHVFVPGNASGCFGNFVDKCVPLIAAITVSKPGKITITYVSGTVTDAGGINTGPDGVPFFVGGQQAPLQEARGVVVPEIKNLDALIGIYVAQSRVTRKGFTAVDGTKSVAPVGIMPDNLFFVGTGRTITVCSPGTLFLGINDFAITDNGGGFNVTVTGP